MKYLIILTFIFVYIFFGLELGYTHDSTLWQHVTFNFQHASIIHLFLNSLSYFLMSRLMELVEKPAKIFIYSFLIAIIASYIAVYSHVTVGASAMIYAMIGMVFALVARKKLIFQRKSLTTWVVALTVSFTASFLNPNSATLLHAVSMVLGFVFYFTLLFASKKG